MATSTPALTKLVTPERPLVIPPLLAAEIGLEEAIILQQINYWLRKSKHIIKGVRWIWQTYNQWQKQFPFLKLSAIRRAITSLKAKELIVVERKSAKTWYQANWYTINREKLTALWLQICQKQTNPSADSKSIEVRQTSPSNQKTSPQKNYSSADNHPPNPAAVLEKKVVEEEEESSQGVMVSQTPQSEATEEEFPIKHENPGEDKFSAAAEREEKLLDAEAVAQLNAQMAALVRKFTLTPCQVPQRAEKQVKPEEKVELKQEKEDCLEAQIPEHEQKLYQIEDAGIRLNAQLEALVRDFTLEEVKNATAYYHQIQRTKASKGEKIDRPAGWFTDCLRQRWWQKALSEPEKSREKEEFEQWYREAIASGLVENVPISWLSTDHYGQPIVRLRKPSLFGAPYTSVPWRQLWRETPRPTETGKDPDADAP